MERMANMRKLEEKDIIGTKSSIVGSTDLVTTYEHDAGFLSTILEAYNNHYNLRTGPEDWWYTIIHTIAIAIDKNSKNEMVKEFFAQDEEKVYKCIQCEI